MDKFGIFKLLNSFFNLSNENNGAKDGSNDKTDSGKNFNVADFLSAFNNNQSAQTSSNKPQQPQSAVEKKTPPPLQSSMLSTMLAHDEFIKRVKEKNKT